MSLGRSIPNIFRLQVIVLFFVFLLAILQTTLLSGQFSYCETGHLNLSAKQVENFLDNLAIFRIGLSWGGVTSLAVVYPDLDRPGQDFGGRLVRLNIGMEATADLITDLESAMTTAF